MLLRIRKSVMVVCKVLATPLTFIDRSSLVKAEAREISKAHPDFVSYIPLKITVVAEREETVLSIVNPHVFDRFYPDAP